MAVESVDACVTDPPYGLEFMGKDWDRGRPPVDVWRAVARVLKPGAHLLAFGGTRTFHRLTCTIEDAGFEIRDCVMWVYGSGFPKSLDVGKAIDKAASVERKVVGRKPDPRYDSPRTTAVFSRRSDGGASAGVGDAGDITAPATDAAKQWDGWGTALKPAWEPIIVARKPLAGTVAENVLAHGVGGLNIDGCRIGNGEDRTPGGDPTKALGRMNDDGWEPRRTPRATGGRWPANLVHDGSDEVVAAFPVSTDGVAVHRNRDGHVHNEIFGARRNPPGADVGYGGNGSAARFFYCAKASKTNRGDGNRHPTVKPVELMRWLCRLVTPPRGLVLDPFMGSGSTLVAALAEGFRVIGIELNADDCALAKRSIAGPLFAEV